MPKLEEKDILKIMEAITKAYEQTGLEEKDILKIMEAITKAYEQAGKKLQTAALLTTEDDEIESKILIDNRDKKDVN